MPEEKKTDYLELAKESYNLKPGSHNIQLLLGIAIAEELRRLNECLESGLLQISTTSIPSSNEIWNIERD